HAPTYSDHPPPPIPRCYRGTNGGGGKAGSGTGLGPIRTGSRNRQFHRHGTSPMLPREPQRTPPKTLAMQSSRDMLEKLRREIDRLAGSIIRQEIVDHGLTAAMTAWHLTDWAWREIQGSTATFYSHCESRGAD